MVREIFRGKDIRYHDYISRITLHLDASKVPYSGKHTLKARLGRNIDFGVGGDDRTVC